MTMQLQKEHFLPHARFLKLEEKNLVLQTEAIARKSTLKHLMDVLKLYVF